MPPFSWDSISIAHSGQIVKGQRELLTGRVQIPAKGQNYVLICLFSTNFAMGGAGKTGFSFLVIPAHFMYNNRENKRMGGSRMKLHQRIGSIAAAACLLAVCIAVPLPSAAESAPPGAIASVTVGGSTSFYYETAVSGGWDAMWQEASAGRAATVKLYSDWIASGSMLVSEGSGSTVGGALCVPSGAEITLDLNGYKLDRALSVPMENGEIICVSPQGTLNLTDTSSSHSGVFTGGNSTNSAGAIQVEAGGSVKLWGGTISGNTTETSGGGIFLAGGGSELYMTGGVIKDNTAVTSGGGIAAVDGSIRVISGEISGNTADGSGGGLYLQGGAADLADCKISGNTSVMGGGICINTEADLVLRSGTSVLKNRLTDEAGAGGGILVMSAKPVRFSGAPSVTMNTDAGGRQSNLVFWTDTGRVYPSGRIEDAGISKDARLGVSFTGGSERDLCIATSWPQTSVLSMDSAEFSLIEKDGALYLRRPAQLPSTGIMVMIGCGTALVLALIGGFVMSVIMKKRQKKRRRKRKNA